MNCRFCQKKLKYTFVDLGMSPLSNAFIKKDKLFEMEQFFPLHAFVCEECFLVQLGEFESPEKIFSDYVYFSSYSSSWLEHAKKYKEQMVNLLPENPYVVEIASNDGYLLQYFKEDNIKVLGIEPAKNVAEYAIKKGIDTISEFFGKKLAYKLVENNKKPNLIIGNNVLAHVPDINDFVEGMKILLSDSGIITMEFPHLKKLMEYNQFDTIYHEHFSYLSLITVKDIFEKHGLKIYDVEEISTHGGSLRIFATHRDNENKEVSLNVNKAINEEIEQGLNHIDTYVNFKHKTEKCKRELLSKLIEIKKDGKSIVAYGAAAKGNTLLNYCGIREDIIDYVVDLNPNKQNLFLPGTHIPVYSPDKIIDTRPDYIIILPWNIKYEIINQMNYVREWGCKFIVPIPEVEEL